MEAIWLVLGVAMGVVLGGAGVFVWARGRIGVAEERARLAEEVRGQLSETIEAAAARAMTGRQDEFLSLAGAKLEPFDRRLQELAELLRTLEADRKSDQGSIITQVEGLTRVTAELAGALQRPGVRGRWGEVTLRRIVELAGMVEHCDFVEQATVGGSDGRLRPDLIVTLPGGACLPVDAKAPLDAYLRAADASIEAERARCLADHAQALRGHMTTLGRKAYWEQFERAPDFVVMFVPGEAFVAAALQERPELLEEGFAQRVILATPSTLMALLRVVAFGWRQERLAESAEQISELARELHRRLASLAGHYAQLGKRLDGAVEAYNKTLGALERRVLAQARKFEQLGAGSSEDIPALDPVEARPRALGAPELTAGTTVVELPDVAERPERAVEAG